MCRLNRCKLTEAGLKDLSNALIKTSALRELEYLLHSLNVLLMSLLRIESCSMDDNQLTSLAQGLSANCTLRVVRC